MQCLDAAQKETQKMNGIITVFDHKKWVFSYVLLAISVWKLDPADLLTVLVTIGPSVLAANWLDKSVWRKDHAGQDT